MGKGDMKTKRGKIIAGSYGKKRPRNPYASKLAADEKPGTKKA